MPFFDTIRAGASGAADAYEIDRSLRFNDGDSPNLFREGGSEGNRRTFTVSVWIKRVRRGEHSWWDFYTDDSNRTIFQLYFGYLRLFSRVGGSTQCSLNTDSDMELRDFGAWYHFIYAVDTTQSTQADRVKMYINGVQQTVSGTFPSQNAEMFVGSTNENRIGCQHDSAGNEAFFDGYMAEFNYIDGQQLTPSSFAETDSTTGQYNPIKYTGSYGTRGYYLNFSDNSGTTATTLGKDDSGNGNNLTPNNFSVSANLTNDSMPDTPTNNFCTLNVQNATTSVNFGNLDGNLVFDQTSNDQAMTGTFFVTSGKWYWEIYKNSGQNPEMGICGTDGLSNLSTGGIDSRLAFITNGGNLRTGSSSTASITGSSSGQTGAGFIRIAVDMDNKKIWFSDTSGTFFNSGNPATGANAAYDFSSHATADGWTPYVFIGTGGGHNCYMNFGQFDLNSFSSNIPAGFSTLTSANLPDPTIKIPDKHFDTVLYSGTGSSNSITGLNFAPDWIWVKRRNASGNHHLLIDQIRGGNASLMSNSNDAENTNANRSMTFNSNGVTWNSDTGNANASGGTYVIWNWNAGGSTASNSNGSITSSIRANTSAGFSIVSYTGNGSNGQTVGHGLGVAPDVIILKARGASQNWRVWHKSLATDGSKRLILDSTNSSEDASFLNDTAPTSTVFTLGNSDDAWNASGGTYIAYLFSEVAGYSKFGSYKGNGNSNGTFVFLGFRPAFLIIKRSDSGAQKNWFIHDNKREGFNDQNDYVSANTTDSEVDVTDLDLLSNGFKLRSNGLGHNASGGTYVYIAIAETPFKYARAR